MTILDDIIEYKQQEVLIAKEEFSIVEIESIAREAAPVRNFEHNLTITSQQGFALIAEVKRASPSKGLIRENFDPQDIAIAYEAGGASCLSVLTDTPSFQGQPEYLIAVRESISLPALRKDFIVDPYQIPQSRAMGADCILLIMACLSNEQAAELHSYAREWLMDVLIEVHDEQELERALLVDNLLIGVNNRNLKTFKTDLETSVRLAKLCPDEIHLVSESGLRSHQDLQQMAANGIRRFLIGESLMRQADIKSATQSLLHG